MPVQHLNIEVVEPAGATANIVEYSGRIPRPFSLTHFEFWMNLGSFPSLSSGVTFLFGHSLANDGAAANIAPVFTWFYSALSGQNQIYFGDGKLQGFDVERQCPPGYLVLFKFVKLPPVVVASTVWLTATIEF